VALHQNKGETPKKEKKTGRQGEVTLKKGALSHAWGRPFLEGQIGGAALRCWGEKKKKGDARPEQVKKSTIYHQGHFWSESPGTRGENQRNLKQFGNKARQAWQGKMF